MSGTPLPGGLPASRRRALGAAGSAAIAVWAMSLAAGCASLGASHTRRLLDQVPPDLPPLVELTDVPFFPQTEYQCGPAALATVLGAAGLPVEPDQLASEVYLPARQGSLQVEMLAAARRHGSLAVRLNRSLLGLLREVAAGTPVVVLQNLGLAVAPQWHYAVVVGYDLPARRVMLRSGVTRRELLDLATFEHTWARGQRWAFVALPPGRLPTSVGEAGVTEALLAFERVAPPDAAAPAYAAAWRNWPDSLTLGMGLGNARYADAEYVPAAMVFENMAKRHGSAAAWNNLAQTRLRLGLAQAAVRAAERAVERARVAEPQWLSTAQATLAEAQAASR